MRMILSAVAALALSFATVSAEPATPAEDYAPPLPENAMPLMPPAHGDHGVGHDALHQWYRTLTNAHGVSCCNETDCRPTSVRTRKGGQLQVMVDGEWYDAMPDKIRPYASIDNNAHVCAPKSGPKTIWEKGHIFCIVLAGGA